MLETNTFDEQRDKMQEVIDKLAEQLVIAVNKQAVGVYKLKAVRNNRQASPEEVMDAARFYREAEATVREMVNGMIQAYMVFFIFLDQHEGNTNG